MKVIATTIQGLEEITIKEIRELTKSKAKIITPSKIEFATQDLKRFKDFSRSSLNCYQTLKKLKFKNIDDIKKAIKTINLNIKNTFAIECNRIGIHKFNSVDIEKTTGEIIRKKYKKKVNLDNPETIIYIDILNNNCFIGLNPHKFKRFYKLKTNFSTINSSLAYSLIRISNYKKSETFLNPYCSSGEIAIEATLFILKTPLTEKPKTKTRLNIYAIDKIIKNCEINSKIAGIYNIINIKKLETDWLDTEFKKNSVDKIVTYIPRNETPKELLNHAEYILKKNGSLTILIQKDINYKDKFKLQKEINIMHGTPYKILHLRKL